MNRLKIITLPLFLTLLAACGDQLVDFASDGGAADSSASDSATTDRGKVADAANADADNADADNADADNADATNADATNADANNADAANADADNADAANADADNADAENADADNADANNADAANADAADAGIPDADGPPEVISTIPSDGAINVSIRRRISVTFSEAMDTQTVNILSFTVENGTSFVPGTVTFGTSSTIATFTPLVDFVPDTLYVARISTDASDVGGTQMLRDYIFSFTTAACGQGPVALGAAADFAVLAGSTVTSAGLTSVIGDLGVSPGTAVTGFPPGIIVGAIHAGNPVAAQGEADLTTAYNNAAGRTLCPVTVAGNLGGQTLPPGLYMSTSSLEISSGDLTLDAGGDPDAVFVFQTASTLTTSPGRQVVLSGGARAGNVFWQVGTSATIGTTSSFSGTILADQAITLSTGATLNGRALARTAAVTMDSNVIVLPAE
jgi:hypothetical protein